MNDRDIAWVLTIVLTLLVPVRGVCQESTTDPRVTWLAEHAMRLTTALPDDRDFSDLAPLETVLRNVSMVMLGEQSHGDGTTFLAKTRLAMYLHQKLGFDVIAFESGLYDCWKAWQHLEAGGEPAQALELALFGLWSQSEQVLPLGDYLAASATTERPLVLAGFDIQPSGRASQALVTDLAAVMTEIGSTALGGDHWRAFTDIHNRLVDRSYVRGDVGLPTHEARERFADAVASIRQEVLAAWLRDESPELAVWVQVLDGIDAYARMIWLVDPDDLRPKIADARIRDAQMAEHLLWLARERYPDRKIIVWAATSHTARHLATVESPVPEVQEIYDGVPTLGELVWQAMGDRMYSLGFTSYEGEAGNVYGTRWSVSTPSAGSLEDLMYRAGLENAIIDFRRPSRGGTWLDSVIVARPMGYGEVRARWSHVLDGMMFTRQMTPSTRVSETPP